MEDELRRFRQSNPPIRNENCDSGDTGTAASVVIESTSEWTDEKHSLYLNSIEESFVNQLYSHDYNFPHGWLLRNKDQEHSSGSNVNNQRSGQFKVQKKGCWEEVKLERIRTQTDIAKGYRNLSANAWIKHFKTPNTGCNRHDKTTNGVTSISKDPPCYGNACHQESIGSSAEASDQNFMDNEMEIEKKIIKTYRKRSKNVAVADTSGKDQVVPYGNSSMLPLENFTSVDRKDSSSSSQ